MRAREEMKTGWYNRGIRVRTGPSMPDGGLELQIYPMIKRESSPKSGDQKSKILRDDLVIEILGNLFDEDWDCLNLQ